MVTPTAIKLNEKLKMIETCLQNGMTPFTALSCSLDDDDWSVVLLAFTQIVKQANE